MFFFHGLHFWTVCQKARCSMVPLMRHFLLKTHSWWFFQKMLWDHQRPAFFPRDSVTKNWEEKQSEAESAMHSQAFCWMLGIDRHRASSCHIVCVLCFWARIVMHLKSVEMQHFNIPVLVRLVLLAVWMFKPCWWMSVRTNDSAKPWIPLQAAKSRISQHVGVWSLPYLEQSLNQDVHCGFVYRLSFILAKGW